MTTDLIARLDEVYAYDAYGEPTGMKHPACQDAIDALEAARAENERLREAMDVQARRLRTVMRNEPIASYELRCDVADQLALAATGEQGADDGGQYGPNRSNCAECSATDYDNDGSGHFSYCSQFEPRQGEKVVRKVPCEKWPDSEIEYGSATGDDDD